MGVENLGEAIAEMKRLLRGRADVAESIHYICDKHGVVERALRRWFEENTEKSPEEYREIKRHIVTLDGAIAAASRRRLRDPYGPNLLGRRFHVDSDDRTVPGRVVRRWYRFIGDRERSIDAIDEETLKLVCFDGDPVFRSEIRQAVKAAAPYEFADRLHSARSDDDHDARRSILGSIRLLLWDTSAPDDLEERLKRAPTLTHLYQSLTQVQRAQLAHQIMHPTVAVSAIENGKQVDPLNDPIRSVLRLLDAGRDVPSPLHDE